MGVLNPRFEEEGTAPGLAAHWKVRAHTALQSIAGFASAPEQAQEDFERWFNLLDSFPEGTLALAFFDALLEGIEDFGEGWGTDFYLTELPDTVITADFAGEPTESHE